MTTSDGFRSDMSYDHPIRPMHGWGQREGEPPMIKAVVIDDSADLRLVTKLWLELDGAAEVIGQAADGLEGFRLLDDVEPDVVVVDVHMPGMDGPSLIRMLRH